MTTSPFFAGELACTNAAPAYDLQPWKKKTSCRGPQCSSSDQFCFFCVFTEPDDQESDGAALWDVVRELVSKRKELPIITETVLSIYNKHIKDNVSWNPVDRDPIDSPEWTREAISRHLMFSAEFPQLFDFTIENIYKSLILAQNNVVMDADTGRVIPEERSALVDTIDAYSRFRRATHIPEAKEPRKRKRSKPKSITNT